MDFKIQKKLSNTNNLLRSLFNYHISISRTSQINEFYNFFYKSRNHYLLNVLIASTADNEKGFAFEEICRLLDPKFASRTTILNILEEGVVNNFFNKKTDLKDHRKQNYTLSDSSKIFVIDWLNKHPFFKH